MIKVDHLAIQKEKIEPFFEQWTVLSGQIHKAHDQRNGQAKQLMEQGIDLFERCVLQSSQGDLTKIDEHQDYEVLPINGMERLLFIKARPAQYACYRQLDELFKELKKRYARLRIRS